MGSNLDFWVILDHDTSEFIVISNGTKCKLIDFRSVCKFGSLQIAMIGVDSFKNGFATGHFKIIIISSVKISLKLTH